MSEKQTLYSGVLGEGSFKSPQNEVKGVGSFLISAQSQATGISQDHAPMSSTKSVSHYVLRTNWRKTRVDEPVLMEQICSGFGPSPTQFIVSNPLS